MHIFTFVQLLIFSHETNVKLSEFLEKHFQLTDCRQNRHSVHKKQDHMKTQNIDTSSDHICHTVHTVGWMEFNGTSHKNGNIVP